LPLPPTLSCCIATAPKDLQPAGRSDPPVLALRRVRLDGDGQQPALEVSEGTSCELHDCWVNGSVRLSRGASAKIIRTNIFASSETGLQGRGFAYLLLDACTIRDCAGDGLLLRHGEADISNCTIKSCSQSGLVLGPGTWRLSGNTLCDNGQYGVWAEAGLRATWSQSHCSGNLLGARGGRGEIAGWQGTGLAPGEECRVWSEQKGKWVKGEVVSVHDEVVVAIRGRRTVKTSNGSAEPDVPEESKFCTGAEVTSDRKGECCLQVPATAVLPPRSGGAEPPAFSQKATKRRLGPYRLFLACGGSGRAGWQKLSDELKAKFRSDSSRCKRKEVRNKGKRKRLLGLHNYHLFGRYNFYVNSECSSSLRFASFDLRPRASSGQRFSF
ncbi:unnamed protein product, partial [Symbiodinium pilosum]